MTRHALSLVLLVGLLALLLPVRVAHADRIGDLLASLRDADSKVRLSAALSLGKLRDRRAPLPLVRALDDADPSVRGVVVAALSRVLTAADPLELRQAAIARVAKMAETDPDEFPRLQAARVLPELRSLAGDATLPGPARGRAIYVELGTFSDTSLPADDRVLPLIRRAARAALDGEPDVATEWQGIRPSTRNELAATGKKAFYVDGTLTAVEITRAAGGAKVTCRASILVASWPERSVFGLLDPARNRATVDTGPSEREIDEAKLACVEALVDSVLRKTVAPMLRSR